LLLDTDGEAPKAETMGVLVQWPGEAAYPQRFAFVASESRPSACLGPALAQEQAARQREELNGLYVALTRTQQTLVVSSMQPHSGAAQSWWQRLEPLLQPVPWNASVNDDEMPEDTPQPPEPDFSMLSLPNHAMAQVKPAWVAIKKVAEVDSDESRIGQAMHRLLEWVAPAAPHQALHTWSDAQRAAVAELFALDAAQVAQAQTAAAGILSGQGAWAWDASALAWHGNEVALQWRGQLLRIDRLVQRQDTGEWWVLDYKSTTAPQTQNHYRSQLRTYQAAVALAYPGQTIRAAFLTPQGALIELTSE
jgi:ATP-dependent helicase/nuclease subunit A